MVDIIKTRIDKYLGFDSDILFFDPLIRIFGGAVRDSIAGIEIHDIDIMCSGKSLERLEHILARNGYTYFQGMLTSLEIGKIYSDINVISEPRTWMKDGKVVQFIRPKPNSADCDYYENFRNLLSNVDISACAVSYTSGKLYEHNIGAISHCTSKTFRVNNMASMYISKRAINRTSKLVDRGWVQLTDNVTDNREDKLNNLLKSDFEYIREYGRINKKNEVITDYDFDDLFSDL